MVRFITDENLPAEVCGLLKMAGHDACSVLEQNHAGCPDEQIASLCKKEDRIFITLDLDFANSLAYPPVHFPGLIVIRTEKHSTLHVLRLMKRIIKALAKDELNKQLWIVEENHIRVRGME